MTTGEVIPACYVALGAMLYVGHLWTLKKPDRRLVEFTVIVCLLLSIAMSVAK